MPHYREQLAELRSRKDVRTEVAEVEGYLNETSSSCDRSVVWTTPHAKLPCSGIVVRGPHACTPDPSYRFHKGVYRGPLFILTNDRTASASEDLAGRLQDNGFATIMGSRTAGSGCGYTNGGIRTELPHSKLEVKMPDCVRYTARGLNEIEGIQPDVEVTITSDNSGELVDALERLLTGGLPAGRSDRSND